MIYAQPNWVMQQSSVVGSEVVRVGWDVMTWNLYNEGVGVSGSFRGGCGDLGTKKYVAAFKRNGRGERLETLCELSGWGREVWSKTCQNYLVQSEQTPKSKSKVCLIQVFL